MVRVVKLVLTPVRYLWILGILLGLGLIANTADFPGNVLAQEVEVCGDNRIDSNQCVEDVCPNIDKDQPVVPDGYFIDQTQDNACIKEPEPQVLGDSTTVTPQVLAETAVVSGK